VFVTRDSMVIRKELESVSTASGGEVGDLLFGRIGNLDQRYFEYRLIENSLRDCVHLDRYEKDKKMRLG
jgi:hypothetical protein